MKLESLLRLRRDLPAAWHAVEIAGLAADSREVKPGYLFAALAGATTDGARFIADAVGRGAAAVLAGVDAPEAVALGRPLIRAEDPRREFAAMAARFYRRQPEVAVAVTGTNGKTSVAAFVRQLWEAAGLVAASIGTIGVVGPRGARHLDHTTPDPVALHALLRELADDAVTHVALEASSHGLAQRRVDGVRLAAGAFTNITRDHLDYHGSFEEYFAQKLRLFREVLPPGAGAVINADAVGAAQVVEAARTRGLEVRTVGRNGSSLKLIGRTRQGFGQKLRIEDAACCHELYLPLVGDFQASNALVAAGLVLAAGLGADVAIPALERLKGARGRLELVAETSQRAPVFVDYAHTPDALRHALEALRPYAAGALAVVFGCGGDRDRGKRPQMGAIAAELADVAYVTDDNPRSENPAAIRKAILDACPGAIEIGDRAEAIARAVAAARQGDVVLIAGKGHETDQIVGERIVPFSDHDAVIAAARRRAIHG